MQAGGGSAVFFGAVPLELAEGGDGQDVEVALFHPLFVEFDQFGRGGLARLTGGVMSPETVCRPGQTKWASRCSRNRLVQPGVEETSFAHCRHRASQ